jgi:hypothetical protein
MSNVPAGWYADTFDPLKQRLGMSSRFGPTVRITFGPTLAETATSNLRG